MKHFRWFLRSFMFYLFVSKNHLLQAYDPLIFNTSTLEIYDQNKIPITNTNPKNELYCAFACPPQERAVKDILLHCKALVIQTITNTCGQQVFSPIVCDQMFELTPFSHSRKDGTFVEFGYQVYFEKSRFLEEKSKKHITTAKRSKFWEIPTQANTFTKVHRWLKDDLPKLKKDERKLELKKWGFVWISRVAVRYDVSAWKFISMRYVIGPITNAQLKMTCENYDLDGEVFSSNNYWKPFNDYYNVEQKNAFKTVKRPEGSCRTWAAESDICVRKYEVLMPYHYVSYEPHSISCSNFTTVPIWDAIPDELTTRIKIFLIAVAQVAKRELIVLPGALKVLTLPQIENDKLKNIYLNHSDKKIPVPELIYKIVRYRSHTCDEKIDLCWFNVVIIIQNHPDVKHRKLCLKDKCEEWGWDYVQLLNINDKNSKAKSKFIYCCRLTEEIADLVDLDIRKTEGEDLNLNHFPRYNERSGELEYDKIQGAFEAQYREMHRFTLFHSQREN